MSIKQLIAERGEKELEKQVNEMNKKHVIPSGICKDNNKRKKLTEAEKKAKQAIYAHNHYMRQKAKKEEAKKAKDLEVNKECFPYNMGRELTATALLDQSAKADAGKPQLSLAMMPKVLEAVARIREYGIRKYKDKDNWKKVEVSRYKDALIRHLVKFLDDPNSTDKESGLLHIDHALCNIFFIKELQ